MWLESRDDDALVAGANLAVLGDELIQFGAAEPLGGRRFRLSRLLRGRRGTEWAAGAHAAGDDFALVETDALVALEAPAGSAGGEARVLAIGIGDDPAGVTAAAAIEGESLRPPSPVHLRAAGTAGGDLALSWVRRSRQGWDWTGGSDTPLGEEQRTLPADDRRRRLRANRRNRSAELRLYLGAAGGGRRRAAVPDRRRADRHLRLVAPCIPHHRLKETVMTEASARLPCPSSCRDRRKRSSTTTRR